MVSWLASGGNHSKTLPIKSGEDYKFQASAVLVLTSFYGEEGREKQRQKEWEDGGRGKQEGRVQALCIPSLFFP